MTSALAPALNNSILRAWIADVLLAKATRARIDANCRRAARDPSEIEDAAWSAADEREWNATQTIKARLMSDYGLDQAGLEALAEILL